MTRTFARAPALHVLRLAISLLGLSPLPAMATLICAAELQPLVLGQVSVRDGFSSPTCGAAVLSCSGGAAGATVQTCLRLGPGSGGAASGFSPRYLRGLDGSALSYQLTAQSSFSAGGHLLDQLDLPLVLDPTGAGQVSPALFAEITALGSQAKVGSYSSSFAGAGDLGFSYGEGSCTQTGDINSFTVSATVAASCAVDVTPMDFGTVNSATSGPLDSTARISVTCTNAAAYTVGLDFGTHSTDTSKSGRQMANGPNTVRYGLFHDAAHSQGWGLSADDVQSSAGTGSRQSLDIHGRVFAGQALVRGLYSDMVVVVITY